MEKIYLNEDWKFVKGLLPSLRVLQMYGKQAETVEIPHDAMIYEERSSETKNGGATGFYPGGIYTYFKTINVPEEWKEKQVVIEFEGVYQTAMVYINGVLAKTNKYGYGNFYVELDRYLVYGSENEIKVVADNSSERNSRWYSGSGIYRAVNLYVGNLVNIPVNGIRAETKKASDSVAVVEFSTKVNNMTREKRRVSVVVEMIDEDNNRYSDTIHLTCFGLSDYTIHQQISVRNPKLWDCETPHLYDCTVKIVEDETILDEESLHFGIRELSLDAVNGLQINGKIVKLRGTCIHHDNGIIGATTFDEAEFYRCKLIKDAGFNSIRSAHHPASKGLLEACDKLGILVMDELCDMWTTHKNDNDFAFDFINEWEDIAKEMINKDFNHPCVVLYSVGNEIQEVGNDRGAEINRMLCNYFHENDGTRFTTNGINALNAVGAKMYPIMMELQPLIQKDAQKAGTNDNSGSNMINSFMKLMEGEAGEAFAVHPIITEVLQESCESMDIIGLNYLTGRHILETELHPNKCVLGTETFPADIARLWSVVNSSNQILGDFTWTGLDYLGEAGCGIFYYDDSENFGSHYPDRTAYIGDIDLVGYRRPISYLREIAYGLRNAPYIAVERVDKVGRAHSKTPWMFKDNIHSWTWNGYEGVSASVDVYSSSDEIELFLNGKSLGRQEVDQKTYTVTYNVPYETGELKAIAYENGKAVAEDVLVSASSDVKPVVEFDCISSCDVDRKLVYARIHFVDKNNNPNLQAIHKVEFSINGGAKILASGNANPSSIEKYFESKTETYDGYCMCIIEMKKKTEDVILNLSIDNVLSLVNIPE